MSDVAAWLPAAASRRVGKDGLASLTSVNHFVPVA